MTKRWRYQYYWYFTYLSGKIIGNIEKSQYDVTMTSSLGVASQNWVWGFFVRRWSLCVNFMTLALLVPEIQRGSPKSPPPSPQSQIDQKSLVWIGLNYHFYLQKGKKQIRKFIFWACTMQNSFLYECDSISLLWFKNFICTNVNRLVFNLINLSVPNLDLRVLQTNCNLRL